MQASAKPFRVYLKGEKFRGKNFHGRKISRISRLLREKNLNFGDVIFAGLKNFRETFRGFSKKNAKTAKFYAAKFFAFKVIPDFPGFFCVYTNRIYGRRVM